MQEQQVFFPLHYLSKTSCLFFIEQKTRNINAFVSMLIEPFSENGININFNNHYIY